MRQQTEPVARHGGAHRGALRLGQRVERAAHRARLGLARALSPAPGSADAGGCTGALTAPAGVPRPRAARTSLGTPSWPGYAGG